MKSLKFINITKSLIIMIFLKAVISMIGFIKKHSDNNTKIKIDSMVSEVVIGHLLDNKLLSNNYRF